MPDVKRLRWVDVPWPHEGDRIEVPGFNEWHDSIVSVEEFNHQGQAWVRVWIEGLI